MAQENVGINVNVQGNAVEAIGNVKKALREANAELINAQANFGDYSDEAIAAAKRVAELKDKISEARETADLFDPGKKFQVFAGAINAVAGGFTAVQGALGIVGAESEELQKSLLKVQSALALSQGLSAITDSAKDFQRLATVVKTNVVSSFTTLRGAIIATGFGALAVGLGLIVANFDKIKQVVLNLFPGLGKLASFFGDLVTKVTDFVGVTSEASRALDKLEKTTKRGNESIEARIKILTAQGGKEKEIFELSKKQGENELDFLRAKLKTKEGLNAEELKKFRDLKTQQAVLDAQEQKRLDNAAKENAKKGAEASKAAAEQRKKDNEDRLAAEKEAQQKLADLNNQLFLSTFKDENERKRKELELAFIKEKDEILANTKITEETRNQLILASRLKLNSDLDALAAAEKEKKKEEDAKLLEESAVQIQNDNDKEFERIQKEIAQNKERNERIKADNDAARDAELQSRMSFAASIAMAIGELNGLFEQGTAASKVAGLAQIAINTGVGFAQGLDIAQKSAKAKGPAAAYAFPIFYATQVAAVLAAAGKARNILSQVKGGGSGVSVTAPSIRQEAPISPAQPQAATTNLSNETINAIGNQAVRAYVVENDVTSNQQRIAAIQQRARFG
jgi:hypothetical protein